MFLVLVCLGMVLGFFCSAITYIGFASTGRLREHILMLIGISITEMLVLVFACGNLIVICACVLGTFFGIIAVKLSGADNVIKQNSQFRTYERVRIQHGSFSFEPPPQ